MAPRRSTPISPSRRCSTCTRDGEFPEEVDEDEVVTRYIKSIGKGILKVMSKMGISTYQSYCGAQIFDAVGLKSDFVDKYFFGTATTIEGVGLDEIADETVRRHADAFGDAPVLSQRARCRRRICLPHARRGPCLDAGRGRDAAARGARTTCRRRYREYAAPGQRAERRALQTIRGLFRIKTARGARPRAGAARRGRAGGRDRQALLHRRDVVRLDLARGAHDAGASP